MKVLVKKKKSNCYCCSKRSSLYPNIVFEVCCFLIYLKRGAWERFHTHILLPLKMNFMNLFQVDLSSDVAWWAFLVLLWFFWLLIQTFSSRDAYVAFSFFDLGKGLHELQDVALKCEGGMLQIWRGASAPLSRRGRRWKLYYLP